MSPHGSGPLLALLLPPLLILAPDVWCAVAGRPLVNYQEANPSSFSSKAQ